MKSGSHHPSTSLTLLQRLRGNDQAAWSQLVHLYAPLVQSWLRRAGLGADADDVQQEVFRAVSSGLAGFRRERTGDTFRGWLRTITRSKIVDYCRRQGRQPQGQGGTDALLRMQEVPEIVLEESEEEVSQVYRRALEILRTEFEESSWKAFWQTAIEGQSAPDVAAQLGLSPAAVRKAKSRVLRRLKEQIGDLAE